MSLQVKIRKKLKDFMLEVEFQTESGMLGILGASGCGKSMTLKSIAGLITPDEGKIVLNGKVVFDSDKKINLPPQKRKVGYLFQNYALFPNMTVEQNIMTGMMGSKQEKQKKVKEMMELLKLEGLENQYPMRLSGGQQQRVALARLLAYDPEIMLLDEPFSALDSYLKEQLQMQLKEILSYYDKTILMVSHDRSEIYRLSDQTMTMKSGQVLQFGKTKEVFFLPKDPVTARLTGCRNLSIANKIDDFHIEAIEWGMVFEMKEKIEKDREIKSIGIHERELQLQEHITENTNCFEVMIVDVLEEPYEYHVLVKTKGVESENKLDKRWKEEIWCSVKKEEAWEGLKKGSFCCLCVDTASILFL